MLSFPAMENDEKKFVLFWVAVFVSAIGFLTIVVHWTWQFIFA